MRFHPWRANPAACVLAVVLSVAAAGESRGQEVDLRPKFEQGQVVRYKLEQNSTSKTSADRDKTKNTSSQMDQTIWISMRTMQVDESGVATVEVSYERVSLSIDSNEFKGSYDTAQPPASSTPPATSPASNPPTTRPPGTPSRPATPPARNPDDRENAEMLALVVRPMLGSKMTLRIDAAGNIISATGGAGLSPSSLVGLDGLKSLPSSSNAGLLGPIFTAKKSSGRARIGETWTSDDTLDASALGSMKMRTTHTLRSAAAGIASIDLAGMIDTSSEGRSGPIQIKDSTFAGRYKWDTARGQLESMDINQSIAMEISIEGLMLSSSHKARTRVTRLADDAKNDAHDAAPAPKTTPAPAPTKPRR